MPALLCSLVYLYIIIIGVPCQPISNIFAIIYSYTIYKIGLSLYLCVDYDTIAPNYNIEVLYMATTKYAWKQMVTLTKAEGERMEQILQEYGCPNLSQFCKKILRNEIILPIPDISDNGQDVLQYRLKQYQQAVNDIQAILDRL